MAAYSSDNTTYAAAELYGSPEGRAPSSGHSLLASSQLASSCLECTSEELQLTRFVREEHLSAWRQPESLHVADFTTALALLQAADFLQDDDRLAACAQCLGAYVRRCLHCCGCQAGAVAPWDCGMTARAMRKGPAACGVLAGGDAHACACLRALLALPEQLAALALRHAEVPLNHLLPVLPPPLHVAAVLASLSPQPCGAGLAVDSSAALHLARGALPACSDTVRWLACRHADFSAPALHIAPTLAALTALRELHVLSARLAAAPAQPSDAGGAVRQAERWAGAAALARALPSLAALTSLQLTHCSITSAALAMLAPAIGSLRALRGVCLSDNRIAAACISGQRCPAGVQALAAALTHVHTLRELEVSGNFLNSDAVLAPLHRALPSCTQLTFLGLGSADCLPALAGCPPAHLRHLRHLDLSRNTCDVDTMQRVAALLGGLPQLRGLALCACCLSSAHVQPLATHALSHASQLTALALARNRSMLRGPAAVGLAHVLPRLRHLQRLDLQHTGATGEFTARLMPAVMRLTELRELNWAGSWIGSGSTLAALVEGLTAMQRLEALDLTESLLAPVGVAQVAAALGGCRVLRVLTLSENRVDADALRELLARARRSWPALEVLQLDATFMGAVSGALLPGFDRTGRTTFVSRARPPSEPQPGEGGLRVTLNALAGFETAEQIQCWREGL